MGAKIVDWSQVDEECVRLCKVLSQIPGIRTVESCCGHGKRKYRIQFFAESLDALHNVVHWFDGCEEHEYYGWEVIVEDMPEFSRSQESVVFIIEGPVGAFDEANRIAELIEGYRK